MNNMSWKKSVLGAASIATTILYPCMFMYFQNIGEGYFGEIFEAVLIYTILALIIGLIAFLILRDFLQAVFFSQIAMLVLMNFNTILGFIKMIMPGMRKAYFFILAIIIGAILLFYLKRKQRDLSQIVMLIGIVFGSLILFNLVIAAPAIVKKITSDKNVIATDGITDEVFTNKPNVYYLLFDEYAGFECLDRYYDYDNAEFETFLVNEGFNISYDSRNEESLWTSTILPNLLNLSYVATDEEYSVDNFAKTKNALMYQMFTNNGYTINMVNHIAQLETLGCNVLNTGKKSETLSTYILENSIWTEVNDVKEWFLYNVIGVETDYGLVLKDTMQILENCPDEVDEKNPTLTVSYICAPHHFFVLDKDGNRISGEYELDWENKFAYLGQLEYTTKCIMNTVKNIKEKDPNALIILQSDHGARYPDWLVQYHDGPEYDKELEYSYMQNILNCVYYKDQAIAIEGLSGINTLRKVFNEVLGTKFEMLEIKE